MFRDTFAEELEYLRELGRAMAREYPVLAPFLDAPEGDPAIERILEGTAFLSAGLREKLDDDVPELTHAILESLAPALMRPGPATSILAFQPIGQMVSEPHRVPAGTEVDARAVEGVSCRFRTVWDVTLLPLALVSAGVQGDVGATPELLLRLQLSTGTKPEDLVIDALRFHLAGAPEVRSALQAWLGEWVADVRLRVPGSERLRQLSPQSVRPVGFAPGEGLWRDAPRVPRVYRLLQEYFTFPEKFSFVDFTGIGRLDWLGDARELEIALRFSRPRAPELQAGPENFLLHCTPIVNLFTRKSAPIPLGSGLGEYRVEPADAQEGRVEVHSVERVEGWTRGAVERIAFPRFDTLARRGAAGQEDVWFRTRQAASVVERRVDTWVSFVDASQQRAPVKADTAVADLLCTNGDLPAQLGPGDVDRATSSSPPVARFRNVGLVVPGAMPPIDAELPWRLLAQFSPNRHLLSGPEPLRFLLASFDLRGLRDRQARRATERRLDGIAGVRTRVEDVFHRGAPARGLCVELELDAECFDGPGELWLFTRLIEEALPLFATENATTRLVVHVQPTGERRERPARRGVQPIL